MNHFRLLVSFALVLLSNELLVIKCTVVNLWNLARDIPNGSIDAANGFVDVVLNIIIPADFKHKHNKLAHQPTTKRKKETFFFPIFLCEKLQLGGRHNESKLNYVHLGWSLKHD